MHVNGIMILVGISKHIGLIQCVCIRKTNCKKLLEAILVMIRKYRAKGVFDVISIGADKAFYPVKSELEDKPYTVTQTTCDTNRHV